jgi:large subunit ribosomal protein L3
MTTPKGLVAKKIGMTRMVDKNGHMVAVTLLQVENQKVTKVLTKERDGYCPNPQSKRKRELHYI